MALTVEAAARTHIGLVRRRNEDSFYAGQWLFAVADGMGGHVAGDVASNTVIEALQPHDHQVEPGDLADVLGRAINTASDALHRKVEAAPQVGGMGTTLVAILWSGTTAVVANVGDSRIYLQRDNESTQITEDHIYGNLVAEAATDPGMADRLTRFLDGRADGRSPDLTTRNLHPGDRFLLCSDGLSSFVPHELISGTLRSPGEPGETADRLVELALERGGPDNITVIIVDVHEPL